MDFEGRQTFAQDAFAELDILEAVQKDDEATEEVTLGFGQDSK
jgi:hypothetical protein